VRLIWIDNATNETGFVIERATNGGAFTQIATLPARFSTGSMSYLDSAVTVGDSYEYRVAAVNATGSSDYSNTATVSVTVPIAPSNVLGTATWVSSTRETVTLNWTDNSNNETRFEIQRASNSTFTQNVLNAVVGADVTTYTSGEMARRLWYFRVRAVNVVGASTWVNATPFPIPTALP
jgi:predicted phage tail protein